MKKSIFLLIVCTISLTAKAQVSCGSCTYSIAELSKENYTLTAGQTLCITSTGVIQGTIVLNGGTICNEGMFSPASFTYTQGNFNNNGVMNYSGTLELSNSGIVFDNNSNGAVNINGLSVNNSNIQITNNGTLNATQNIVLTSGTVTNNGTMNYNALNNNGATYTNNGTANCCGN